MAVKVKICGVRTPAVIEAAADEGADYIGLVLFPSSPRHVEIEAARVLAAIAKGKLGTVAVLVDADDALIAEVAERVRPDVLQLHGSETPQRVAAVKAASGLPVIKAISVAGAADIAEASRYAGAADFILFDAKAPSGAAIPGGNGIAFDWTALKAAKAPFALSGGLTPDTVADAILLTSPSLVDVSSGVELSPGEKDIALVRRFIQAAKSAIPQAGVKAS